MTTKTKTAQQHHQDFGLEKLDITTDELEKFRVAFQNDEFKQLFSDYYKEISDPDNRRKYEEELIQLEAERGVDVKFVNPEPGFVLKTIANGSQKVFINIAKCSVIGVPTSSAAIGKSGERGLNWSIPYTQSAPKHDSDKKGEFCVVYDVIFHPDTLHLAGKNSRFRQLVIDTAIDAVQREYNVEIDAVNLKFPKIAYKGTARATIIRRQCNTTQSSPITPPSPIDCIYPPIPTPPKQSQKNEIKTPSVEKYTTPKYTITQRRNVELHEMTNELDAKLNVTVPHELIISIDLPLLTSTADCTLDVTERKIFLISERPAKYKLELKLPYDCRDIDGTAKFDKVTRKLLIRLPVAMQALRTMTDLCREDSGVESDHDAGSPKRESDDQLVPASAVINEPVSPTESHRDAFLDSTIMYNIPSFTCNILDTIVAFTLHVRNVDQSSLNIHQTNENNQPTVQIKFQSIGSGCYPIPYAFAIQLPDNGQSTILSVDAEAWDNNVILQIELSNLPHNGRYLAGNGNLIDLIEYEFIADDNSSLSPTIQNQHQSNADPLNVDVRIVSDDEIKIEITKKENDDVTSINAITNNDKEKCKKKKRKNKKIRSFSESHCDELLRQVEQQHRNDNNKVQTTKIANDLNATSASIDIDNATKQINGGETIASVDDVGNNVKKTRSLSESSNDDQSLTKHREIKGILKRRSSYHRSISESSNDDHMIPYSIDFGVGSIPEENCGSGTEMSESYKKHVRFDNNIQKQLFRMRSSIVGQRKPQAFKRKNKKHNQNRRYSEGESSDYESKSDELPKSKTTTNDNGNASSQQIQSRNKHDSGVDLSDGNDNDHIDHIEGDTKQQSVCGDGRKDKKKQQQQKDSMRKNSSDLEFKCGMIFDIEM